MWWWFVGLAVLLVLGMVLFLKLFLHEPPKTPLWYPNEKLFEDPHSATLREFPSISDLPAVDLTLIVPAYNEEDRLPVMLDQTLEYLRGRQSQRKFSFEIIIVDDGSRDKTANVALNYVRQEGSEVIRLLKLAKNRGKGGAIKRGMLCGRGKYLLMVDADGATKFSDLEKLENSISRIESNGLGIAVGSRAQLKNSASTVKKSFLRNVLTWGFHFLVDSLCVKGVQDTQCGFKLFTRSAAHDLFRLLHIERWAFDVELLYLAQTFKIPIVEVNVSWTEIEGSKVSPFWDSLKMARDLVKIRLMYMLGIWSTDTSRFIREA